MKPIVLVVGTRAEAIKLIPVYLFLKQEGFPVVLCATSQHLSMLEQVCNLFGVVPDYNLKVMKENQDIFHVHTEVLNKTKKVYEEIDPSLVLVHGDTTTTLAAAQAAFYLQIPIGHVEAGLRTGDMRAPFPEEMNRKVVGQIATYHFTPTAFATANILSEGVSRENVFCTGNTIVDALNLIKNKIKTNSIEIDAKLKSLVADCRMNKRKMILLTAHRRESFNGGLTRVFKTIKSFAQNNPDAFIFYPYHPNPNVLKAIEESKINDVENICVLEPLAHQNLIYTLMNIDFVVTDSGGIQEEAVSLGKRVICLRDSTERHEGVWEGIELLVGTDPEKILDGLYRFYNEIDNSKPSMIYGDGLACQRIASILRVKLKFNNNIFISKEHKIGESVL